ncbi:MAG TPA: hypothetical protein DCM87_19570 [Planctomycetes bacterium]|nr:hypothetical protein [Planctomycetota bacterium]
MALCAAGALAALAAVVVIQRFRIPPAGEDRARERAEAPAPPPPAPPPAAPAPERGEPPARRQLGDLIKSAIERETGGRPAEDGALRGLDIDGLIAILSNESASLKDRRGAAWKLARSGDPRALAALEEAYAAAPPQLKAGIAEALGICPAAQGRDMLVRIIEKETDETALRGAVRGIAAAGGGEGVEMLDSILRQEARPASVRGEAALSLGSVPGPEALAALRAAYETFAGSSDDLAEDVLAGLGCRHIDETRDFFASILDAPAGDNARRVAALDALENAEGEIGPFAAKYLGDDDPEVRAAAAWSIAAAEEPGDVERELADVLGRETDGLVRARLYQALANQERLDIDAAFGFVEREVDAEARRAGLQMLARHAAGAAPEVQERFDAEAAPELLGAALQGDDVEAAMSAVISLRQARTPGAKAALAQIAEQGAHPKIKEAAARGL